MSGQNNFWISDQFDESCKVDQSDQSRNAGGRNSWVKATSIGKCSYLTQFDSDRIPQIAVHETSKEIAFGQGTAFVPRVCRAQLKLAT